MRKRNQNGSAYKVEAMLTVILTGGKSSRMGRDKATLPYRSGDRCMRDELIHRYSLLGNVAVSVSHAGQYTGSAAIEIPDAFPGMGPINGIYSAFKMTDADVVFLTATDVVNGDTELVRYLENMLGCHDACVIRRKSGDLEPLFALYTRNCLAASESSLRAGRRSVRGVIDTVSTVFVEERDLCGNWNLDEVLLNINTPKDYEKFKVSGL